MDHDQYDFFLSRRGAVANLSREVAEVLSANGFSVLLQDYDIPLTSNFIERMHEAIKRSRDLVILFTQDYEESPFTRKEFTSFEADRVSGPNDGRRIIVLRCEDVPLRGLLAANVYQDLAGVEDRAERASRILAAVRGQSQAERPPPRPFVGVPPRLLAFTGRGEALDKLDDILMRADSATEESAGDRVRDIGRATIHGVGGVGKSSLASEYAHRFRDLYAGVWWCPAETRIGLVTALAELARKLGADSAETDLDVLAKSALTRLATSRANWLLVYDNVPSPDEIADLLPNGGARLLVTSRFPDWAGWAREVALDVMPDVEAQAFLRARTGRDDAVGALVLARALGGLPLALDHASAYCRRTQTPFAGYAARVETMLATAPRGVAYPRSVAATFTLAIADAVAQAPASRRMLDYIAQCAPERVPLSFVTGVADVAGDASDALLALVDTSLVRNDPFPDGRPAVTMHRLVQAIARAAASEPDATQARLLMLRRLRDDLPAFDEENVETYPAAIAHLPHGLMLAQPPFSDPDQDVERIEVVLRQIWCLHALSPRHAIGRGEGDGRAATMLRGLQAHAIATHGALHPATSAIVDQLMRTLSDNAAVHELMEDRIALFETTQRLEALEALNMTIWMLRMVGHTHRHDLADRVSAILARDLPALAEQEGLLGERHLAAACSAAEMHRIGKRFADGRALLGPILRAMLASEPGATGQLLQMAMLYLECRTNEPDEFAEALIGELEREALIEPTNDLRLDILNGLAQHFRLTGRYARAKYFIEQILRLAAGADQPNSRLLWARTQQRSIAIAIGDFSSETATLTAEIAEARKTQGIASDAVVRDSIQDKINWKCYTLADIYTEQKYLIKAVEMFRTIKSSWDNIDKTGSGPRFYDRKLAQILAAQGHIDEAIALIADAGDSEVEADMPFDRAFNQAWIGTMLHDAGRVVEARPFLSNAYSAYAGLLELPQDAIESAGRSVASLRDVQGQVKRRLGNLAMDADDSQRGFERFDGDSLRIANLDTLEDAADWRQSQGEFAEALRLLQEIFRRNEDTNGADSIRTALALSDLGDLHLDMGDLAAARDCQDRALRIGVASQGDDAPLTARLRGRMAALLLREGRVAEAVRDAQSAYETLLATAGPGYRHTRRALEVVERAKGLASS